MTLEQTNIHLASEAHRRAYHHWMQLLGMAPVPSPVNYLPSTSFEEDDSFQEMDISPEFSVQFQNSQHDLSQLSLSMGSDVGLGTDSSGDEGCPDNLDGYYSADETTNVHDQAPKIIRMKCDNIWEPFQSHDLSVLLNLPRLSVK